MKRKKMAELILNQTKDSVYIRFTNGKESLTYESVPEIITAIHDCYVKGKITEEEEYYFIETLLFSENNLSDRFSIELKNKKLFNLIIRIIKNNTPMLENPTLKMCDCGKKPEHARLISTNGFCSPPLYSKDKCLILIQGLVRDNLITEGEFAILNTLTDMFPLIENPILN